MRSALLAATALMLMPATALAQASPPAEVAVIPGLVAQVSAERIEADVRTLVGFGTRHSLSETVSDTRGIGAARRWVHAEFERISAACGGCLEVIYIGREYTGERVPEPTEIISVVAIQRGTSDPNRHVLIGGHLDSRVTDVMNATDDAPGANDDASGVAGTLEAARVLSTQRFPGSIVYVAFSGEEQGLVGARFVAEHARDNDWRLIGVLNNDMIGNIRGITGAIDNGTARVFSEGPRVTRPRPRPANAASPVARSTVRRAIWLAMSMASPTATSPTSTRCWSIVWTGSDAAATTARSTIWAFRPSGSWRRWRTMTASIRICAPRTAGPMAM